MDVSVVETRHDELLVQIKDASLRTDPWLYIGIVESRGRRFGIRNGDDPLATDCDSAGPFVLRIHRFDPGVREDEIGGTCRGRRLRLISCEPI